MVRVLQVIHSMNLGGAENFIMNIYRAIDRTKVQFDFLVNATGVFDEEILQMGGKIWTIPYVNEVGPFYYRRELKKFFSEHPEYQIVHSHLDMVSGEVIECAKKMRVQRCITHSHNTNTTGNLFVKMLKHYYRQKISRYADVQLACSRQAGIWLYHDNRAIVINNAIDLKKFQFKPEIRTEIRKKYNIAEQALVIGHVGRFSKVKNHRFLVQIFDDFYKTNKNAKLLLCGDGPEKIGIKKLVEEKDLIDQVVFYDASTDVCNMYHVMDVFVFPSIYEGMSLAMLEAQANGLPIVASDSIDSEVDLTGNVEFVSLNADLALWVKAIGIAVQNGRCDGREQLRSAGFDIDEVADQLLKYYQAY